MKLFIWKDPYHVAFGTSMYMAVAENVTQARKLVKKARGYYSVSSRNMPKGPPWILGKPTRVVKLPCAEFHEWSE